MKEQKTRIRNVLQQDIPFLLSVFERSVRQTCAADYSPEEIEAWVKKGLSEEKWIHRVKTHYFILAETPGGKISGFCSSTKDAYLDVLFVDPDFQGYGIARQLVERVKQESLRSGHKQITTHASKTARPFFEHQGFKVTESNVRNIFGVPIMNYHMIWVS